MRKAQHLRCIIDDKEWAVLRNAPDLACWSGCMKLRRRAMQETTGGKMKALLFLFVLVSRIEHLPS
jgi:hypothetical protein